MNSKRSENFPHPETISKGWAEYLNNLVESYENIGTDRRTLLKQIASEIRKITMKFDKTDLIFVCTHNSRRSQLAELWSVLAANHYNLPRIKSWSGGTEATAFNHRMVTAIQSKGIALNKITSGENPRYSLSPPWSIEKEHVFFSKKYDDPFNPNANFVAVMVCDHADQNCPVVQGAHLRISLPYIDPKEADDTPEEALVYEAKVDEIGREILFLFNAISLTS